MIDFRYHLVSLASVLIALAVGIVLGAGPLNSGILQSVNSEVNTLREDKADLRSQLDTTTKALGVHQSFEASRLATLVADKLSGRTVVVVDLPGAPSSVVSTTEDTLTSAGAILTGRITLGSVYADPAPAAQAARAALASEVDTALAMPAGAVAGSGLDPAIAACLTERTVTGSDGVGFAPTPEARTAAWKLLLDAGVVSRPLPAQVATSVVVIGGPALETSPDATAWADAEAGLAGSLDSRADGAVLVGDLEPSETRVVSPLMSVRTDSAIRQHLSTVDDVGTTLGQVSVVDALTEQLAGASGQYGTLTGATRVFPPVG
ncbi:MAG: copper transporter [Tetrasphaera sp.]|nr:copper transporter [Tetrasphaera sp.]